MFPHLLNFATIVAVILQLISLQLYFDVSVVFRRVNSLKEIHRQYPCLRAILLWLFSSYLIHPPSSCSHKILSVTLLFKSHQSPQQLHLYWALQLTQHCKRTYAPWNHHSVQGGSVLESDRRRVSVARSIRWGVEGRCQIISNEIKLFRIEKLAELSWVEIR